MEHSFTADLPNLNSVDAENDAGRSVEDKMLLELTKNPKITRKEFSINLNISIASVYRNLNSMKNNNIIRRVGRDKGGHWEIIDNKKDRPF